MRHIAEHLANDLATGSRWISQAAPLQAVRIPILCWLKGLIFKGLGGARVGWFWFYLVRGTSSLWSSVTGEDLLSTEGAKVTKASVLLAGEQVKSEAEGLAERPFDWLE